MKAIIKRSTIKGSIAAPQSKSYAIRLLFLSLLTDISIENLVISEDVLDALNAVSVFNVSFNNNRFYRPPILKLYRDYIYFKGSATVLRMFIPIVAVIGGKITIDGSESLRKRPLNAIINALSEKGIKFSSNRLPITIEGKVKDPYIDIYGGESSQYISGLIIALMLAGGGTINIRGRVSSKSYIYLTSEIINSLGGNIYIYNNRIVVEPSNDIKSYRGVIPGDYLLASFYAASALLTNGELFIHGLPKPFSFFGDHSIVDIYRSMGATSLYRDGIWYVKSSDEYKPIYLDIDDAPDLAPSIAPLAAIANGKTTIRGVERLTIKESNRRDTIALTLRSFGIEVFNKEDYIEIIGGELREGIIVCPDDHRIAMMATSMALRSGGSIDKAECVYKSNPSFWRDLELLGGSIYLV